MGGENESLLKKDPTAAPATAPQPTVLLPDVPPTPSVMLSQNSFQAQAPLQTQAIRQHMNAGQIHLHCDEQQLKAAVPVAEWYVIMRNLRSLSPFTWVDSDNKCVAYFRPFISQGMFEVSIELAPVSIGNRFNDMVGVTGKR